MLDNIAIYKCIFNSAIRLQNIFNYNYDILSITLKPHLKKVTNFLS